MTAQKFKPLALAEIAGEQHTILLAKYKKRSLVAAVSLFMVSPAFTLFIVVDAGKNLYTGKFLDRAVRAYNGEQVVPDEEKEIHPVSPEGIAQKDDFGAPILRRRHRLL